MWMTETAYLTQLQLIRDSITRSVADQREGAAVNIHRRLLTIAGPVWRQVGLTLAASLAMSATLLAQAFLVGVILQRLFAGRPFAQVSGLLVAVAVPRLVDQAVGRRGKEHWQAYQDLGAEFVDELQGMTTVKAFNATRRHRRTLLDRAATLHRMTMRHMAVSLPDADGPRRGRAGRRRGAGRRRRGGPGDRRLAGAPGTVPGAGAGQRGVPAVS